MKATVHRVQEGAFDDAVAHMASVLLLMPVEAVSRRRP
ncbi:hypothetical protein D8I24_1349 [Cupriavidus necator H850]|nr:hypothetical protein D8I24_1349 [Cupriavidus necator H850]